MSLGDLAVELFQSVPYGKRAILVAKQANEQALRLVKQGRGPGDF